MSRDLRSDALACLRAAIAAADPERLVREYLEAHPEALDTRGELHVAAVGKAAAAMLRGATTKRVAPGGETGERFASGVVILPRGAPTTERVAPGGEAGMETTSKRGAPRESPAWRVFRGGHPTPNREGIEGARAVLETAVELGEEDLLLVLLSGGGSALMTLPPEGVPLAAVQETTDLLLRAGADIWQLNTVRKHLDRLKGGRLARAAAPARVLALVLSDVVADPLNVIASGPVSPDPTTYGDALSVLQELSLRHRVPPTVREHFERGAGGAVAESPGPGDAAFERVRTRIVGNNRTACEGAAREAAARGYSTLLLGSRITGEAREVGRVLAGLGAEARGSAASGAGLLSNRERLQPPLCLIAGGETTVTVTGGGKGGRNQEVALGAALALHELRDEPRPSEGTPDTLLVAAAGTDGIDGPTDAAGGLATASTVARAAARGLDVRRALADNDAYPLLAALDDLVVTGPTGTNVTDLFLVLVADAD